jgi:hypothetical protein
MKQKKLYTERLCFSKAELMASQVDLSAVGINLPIKNRDIESLRKEYNVQGDISLGSMWGSMNDPKYYKDLQAQDIVPKPEDFIEVPFRLLSATTVGAGTWKATDFSDEQMLKKSMEFLIGKPMYKDHETDLDNWIGLVRGVSWEKSKEQNGIKVPAGINGLVAIDAKTNPKTARGVLLGSIFSNSVTVEFKWEQSHEFESEWDFYDNIGTLGKDGKMIRRVVKEITNYHESSLVWLGADPFAKAITENGELKNIDYGSVYEYSKTGYNKTKRATDRELSKEEVKELLQSNKKYTVSFAMDKGIIPLAKYNEKENKNDFVNMDKFIQAFIATFGKQLGITDEKPSEEQLISYLKELQLAKKDEESEKAKELITKVTELMKATDENATDLEQFLKENQFVQATKLAEYKEASTKVSELTKQVETLTTEAQTLKKDAEVGMKYRSAKKEEAIRLYKATVGVDNVQQAVIDLFNKAEDEAIDGLLAQYTKGATEKFSGTCADCGSHNFKFQSSFSGGEEPKQKQEQVEFSAEDIRSKYLKSSMNIGS